MNWPTMSPADRIKFISERAATMTATQIAGLVGATRNSIIGYCHRNGIKLTSGTRQDTGYRQIAREGAKYKSAPTPPAIMVVNHDPIPLMSLTKSSCRWPVDTDTGIMFCGRHTERIYCDEHHARAHVPPDVSKRKMHDAKRTVVRLSR